jgi:ABC-2 type transport system permease protein
VATGLSVAAFLALGYALAGLAPTARVAMAVGNVLVYPMVVLSGASVPLEVMPATVQQIARFVPLTYMVRLFKGLWFAEGWGSHWGDVAVLLGVLAAGLLVVGLTFRWE